MTKKKSTKKKSTKKKAAKKKVAPDDNGFEAWLAENRGCKRLWHRWPDSAVTEISKTLEHNDQSDSHVTADRMVERLRGVYGIKLSPPTLTRYCKDALGRRGWKRK